jgi:hypothetical protein
MATSSISPTTSGDKSPKPQNPASSPPDRPVLPYRPLQSISTIQASKSKKISGDSYVYEDDHALEINQYKEVALERIQFLYEIRDQLIKERPLSPDLLDIFRKYNFHAGLEPIDPFLQSEIDKLTTP